MYAMTSPFRNRVPEQSRTIKHSSAAMSPTEALETTGSTAVLLNRHAAHAIAPSSQA
jgi:hypothetical protein